VGERSPGKVDEEIGRRLRNRRLELGLSQEQVAHAVGVTFQQLQKYEKGVNRVSASKLYWLAKALDIAPAALLPNNPHFPSAKSAHSSQVRAVVEAFSELRSGEQREAMVALLDAIIEDAQPARKSDDD
jgi:transcriptional regulator with XRE-family HTH domain